MIEKLFVEREEVHLYALFRKNISAGLLMQMEEEI